MLVKKSVLSFLKNNDGASATEFALIAPIVIGLFLGSVDITRNLRADEELSLGAAAISDLVAQETRLTTDQLEDIIIGAREIMGVQGIDADITIMSLSVSRRGAQQIDWVYQSAGAQTKSSSAGQPPPVIPTVDVQLIGREDSMIITQGDLKFDPLFNDEKLLKIEIKKRPRNTSRVLLCDSGGNCR